MPYFKLPGRALSIFLACQITLAMQMSTVAQAEMLTTQTAIEKYSAYADRDFLLAEVRSQEVRDGIIALGIDPAEAEARLEALSDREIASIIARVESEPAGAGAGGGIIGAFVTVFIILLVTDLLCFTKVFSFTRCQVN